MSNLSHGISFGLNSLEDFESRSLAGRIIQTLLAAPKFLVPKFFGQDEPLKLVVDSNNIEPVIDLLVSQKIESYGGPMRFSGGILLMGYTRNGEYLFDWEKYSPSFSGVSGSVPWPVLEEEPSRFGEFLSLVKALVGVVNPVYGDIQNMRFSGWDTPLDLQKRLPDVPWLSIYGEPYIQTFGEEKILNAPFYKIEKLPSGHFWLQASESIHEPVTEIVRSAIRKHFGEDSFMAHPKWRYKNGKAPRFDFSKVTNGS
ncbi:MAG TPA: hypothetical protein VFK27_03720 [Bacillales bacterium]|nr:hypothetical protein [Bacillales bacterium]